jgi:uncharacterized protein (TIGR03437 family)
MSKLAGLVQGEFARTQGLPHEHASSSGRGAMIARSCVLLTLACALAGFANAQFVQQDGKLVGAGEVGNAELGNSVALSSDGNTAIVGGPGDNGNAGAAWVYTRSGGVWTQQGGKLVGAGAVAGAYQGTSVALSSDGNTAIVGGPSGNVNNSVTGVGAAWVYTRSGGVWTQQGNKLVAADAVGNVGLGFSVALSSDGNTAIVGGPGDNGNAGAAWIYTRSGGVWTQQGGKLVGAGAVGGAYQGLSVALSGDGNTAIVGGPGDNGGTPDGAGAAWVYTRSGGVWTQQGSKLVGSGAVGTAEGALQGFSVALSADGNTALVGGPNDNYVSGAGDIGATWVYTRSGGVWTQQGGKLVGTGGSSPGQGFSAALSADGNTAIVGGPNDNGNKSTGFPGAAWVYTRSGGVWTQQGSKLFGAGTVGNASQGTSVALSGDGNTALVGGPVDNGAYPSGVGAAWVFVSSTTASAPSIASGGVVNGASFLPGIAPGSWITIEGVNLSGTTRPWNSSDFTGSNLPTQLDGVSVSVGGQLAYVAYISPTQINAVAPNVGTGTTSVTVTDSSGISSAVAAVSQAVQPAFFQWGAYAVATRQDYSLAVKNGTFSGLTTAPAKPGDIIILWGTGFGPTSPPAPVGVEVPTSPTYYTTGAVTVTVGSVPATAYGAALASGYAGLFQVAIQVPNSLASGDYPVIATVSGAQSPSTTLITVQN